MITGYQCSQCFEMCWSEQEAFAHLRKNHPEKFAAFYNIQKDVEKPEVRMLRGLRRARHACLLARNEKSQTSRELLLDEAIQIIDRTIEQ